MSADEERSLSLAEWLVLCLVCEEPRHGFAIARILGREGSMGRIWRGPKPVIYRGLQRLELLGPVPTPEQQQSSPGPGRALVDAPQARRPARADWLPPPRRPTPDLGAVHPGQTR